MRNLTSISLCRGSTHAEYSWSLNSIKSTQDIDLRVSRMHQIKHL